jgi:hypothetical protein
MLPLASSVVLLATSVAWGQTITRGPYLQKTTTSGITVRWRTDVATDSRVQYGAAPGSLTNTVDDLSSTTEHIVPISGLSSDTRYYYSVGIATGTSAGILAGDDADHYFRTFPPAGPARPTRMWVIGDAGFAGANLNAVRDAYANYNAGNETDLFLLMGDNAYVLATDADYQAALFDTHADLLQRVVPWPTFGNHEAFSSNSLTETGPYFDMFTLPEAGESGGVPSGTESYYSFDFANIHLIVLDGHASSVAPASPMMTWLEADLQATTADWVIAFWHQPPYSKGLLHDSDVEAREIAMRQNVVPMLEDYGVDLVLNGHSHNYERSYLLDGHYGFSPTLTSDMVLDSGDGQPSGDGAYRKENLGPAPHEGAVYAVVGSSSDVRNTTLNHPAMRVGLLQLGSLVVDVDGDTLTGTFLNSAQQTTDSFTIVKGVETAGCPSVQRSGCTAAGKGKLLLKDNSNPNGVKLLWKFKKANVDAGDVGDPNDQTNLSFCLYDQSGRIFAAALAPDETDTVGDLWTLGSPKIFYTDDAGAAAGIKKVKIKTDSAGKGLILIKAKGPTLPLPALPLTLPATGQFVNLDNGKCWEATFTSAKVSEPDKLVAVAP